MKMVDSALTCGNARTTFDADIETMHQRIAKDSQPLPHTFRVERLAEEKGQP